MKTALLFTLFCLLLPVSFAQETASAIELVQMNLLFRNHDNPVKIAVSNCDDCRTVVNGMNCIVREDSVKGNYILRPGSGKLVIITVKSYRADSLVYSNRSEFRVSNIPDAVIYWGETKAGGTADLKATRIYASYPPEIPLASHFLITQWEVSVDGKVKATGMGNNLASAADYFNSLDKTTQLLFLVTVQSPDGILRKMIASFVVEPE